MTATGWSLPVGVLAGSRFDSGLAWITFAACVAACVPAGLRWLRVAQREHYLAGSAVRFAVRWWRSTPANGLVAFVAVAAALVSLRWPIAGVATVVAVAGGPLGLSLQGRTSPLAWTRRLRTLAAAWALLEGVLVLIGVVTGLAAPLAALAALAVPVLVDLACGITFPLERRLSAHYVDEATGRLERVGPIVIAVTGSFGKTSTKNHIAHLVGGARAVVATPASFNNRAGLARAVNEHLAEGTEVFVAEMGTYGRGEIADLCRWCPPDIAVVTAIGPVHLERFGSEERIVEAKGEIIEAADDVVLPVDDPRLAALADRATAEGKRVLRCSGTDRSADVFFSRRDDRSRVTVLARGSVLVEDLDIPTGVQPTNLACAIGVALVLEVEPATIVARLRDLPPVDHRLSAIRSPSGLTILDDTYNSNPVGAAAALRALVPDSDGSCPSDPSDPRRLAVVTPGMVELGPRQFAENREFGAAAAALADDLVIVGRTNRRALEAGAETVGGTQTGTRMTRMTRVTRVKDRTQAVDWVRENLSTGDTVLYENDLPDHYP